MKKFLILVGIVFLIFVAYQKVPFVHHFLSYSPCRTPLTYKIGSVDSRFGLSTDAVLKDVNEASSIWNQAMDQPIFEYDPDGKITINMVYDQRQKLSTQVNQLQQQITSDKNTLDPQIADYEQRSQAFDQKAADLNQQIDYWNSKGGAPPDVYQQLTQEQKDLQTEAEQLNALARTLKQSTRDYNSQITQLNQTENNLSQTLAIKPEEGLWNGNDNTISIYFNNTHAELIHTLAHELGHARGLDHNTNQNSIMYPSSTEVITPSPNDLRDLQNICKERSYLELIIRGYRNLIEHIVTQFRHA